MAQTKITVRNTINGQVAKVDPSLLDNPHLAKHYVLVEDDAKPMPLMKPTTAEEFVSRRGKREKKTSTEGTTEKTEEG